MSRHNRRSVKEAYIEAGMEMLDEADIDNVDCLEDSQVHETCRTSSDTKDTNPKDLVGITKAPLGLVPPALVIEVAAAMKNGADKYGPYNWREKGVRLSVYLDAIERHLAAFKDGEERAQDSGVKHLAHAAACFGIIFDAASLGMLIDDRPEPGAAAELLEAYNKGEL